MAPKQTPSQTVGPFFAYGLTPEQYGYDFRQLAGAELLEEGAAPITIRGQVFDGDGETVGDAVLELWQADSRGRYDHGADPRRTNSQFGGFARTGTGTLAAHCYEFRTIKPGAIGTGQAPHINVILFMRGLLNHVHTRIYFSDEAARNQTDPVLALVEADRRDTLIARREDHGGKIIYHFDIHMQGNQETVFFDA